MSVAASNSTDKSASLKKGQRFELGGFRWWRVLYVNASRAHCVAVVHRPVTIRGRTFQAKRQITLDIAPNSGVDVLAELERGR